MVFSGHCKPVIVSRPLEQYQDNVLEEGRPVFFITYLLAINRTPTQKNETNVRMELKNCDNSLIVHATIIVSDDVILLIDNEVQLQLD